MFSCHIPSCFTPRYQTWNSKRVYTIFWAIGTLSWSCRAQFSCWASSAVDSIQCQILRAKQQSSGSSFMLPLRYFKKFLGRSDLLDRIPVDISSRGTKLNYYLCIPNSIWPVTSVASTRVLKNSTIFSKNAKITLTLMSKENFIFHYKFRFYTSNLSEFWLHCHLLGFSWFRIAHLISTLRSDLKGTL